MAYLTDTGLRAFFSPVIREVVSEPDNWELRDMGGRRTELVYVGPTSFPRESLTDTGKMDESVNEDPEPGEPKVVGWVRSSYLNNLWKHGDSIRPGASPGHTHPVILRSAHEAVVRELREECSDLYAEHLNTLAELGVVVSESRELKAENERFEALHEEASDRAADLQSERAGMDARKPPAHHHLSVAESYDVLCDLFLDVGRSHLSISRSGLRVPGDSIHQRVKAVLEKITRLKAENERLQKLYNPNELQDDLTEIMNVIGIPDHARPVSPHRVFRDEVIPAVEHLRDRVTRLKAENERLKRCPTCNAGPDVPICAYPTEHAKRLRDAIERLRKDGAVRKHKSFADLTRTVFDECPGGGRPPDPITPEEGNDDDE